MSSLEDDIQAVNRADSKLADLRHRLSGFKPPTCPKCQDTGIREVTTWQPDDWEYAFCDCEVGRVKGLEDV